MPSLTVLSVLSSDIPFGLAPTPNVSETMYITDILKQDTTPRISNFTDATLTILTSYRGWILYCAGDVTVERHSPHPSANGGNGLVSLPAENGAEEDVYITSSAGKFCARVRFE